MSKTNYGGGSPSHLGGAKGPGKVSTEAQGLKHPKQAAKRPEKSDGKRLPGGKNLPDWVE